MPSIITSVLAAILNLLLALFALRRDHRTPANRYLALTLLSIAAASLAAFFGRSSQSPAGAYIWVRVVLAVALFGSLFFLRFTSALRRAPSRTWVSPLQYASTSLMALLALAGFFIDGLEPQPLGVAPTTGLLFPLFIAFISLLSALAIKNLACLWKTSSSPHLRNQSAYLLIAFTGFLAAQLLTFLLQAPSRGYPSGVTGITLFAMATTWTMFAPRLPDIYAAVRKAMSFGLLIMMASAGFFLFHLPIAYLDFGGPALVYNAIFMVVMVVAFVTTPLAPWAQTMVDKAIYRGRYHALASLQRFIKEPRNIDQMENLPASLTALIASALKAGSVHLFLLSSQREIFLCVGMFPPQDGGQELRLLPQNTLAIVLKQARKAFAVQEMNSRVPPDSFPILDTLHSSLILPLKMQDALIGFVSVGDPASTSGFGQGDITILDEIAPPLAQRLRNFQLYQAETARVRDLASLRQSIAIIESHLDRGAVLDKAVAEGARLLETPAAAVWEIEGQQGNRYWTIKAATGLSPEFVRLQKVPLQAMPPAGIDDPKAIPPFMKFTLGNAPGSADLNAAAGMKVALAIPIIAGNRMIAGLSFFDEDPERTFSAWDIEMARNFANHIGIALENTRLYEIERQQREELQNVEHERQIFLSAITHELRTPITSMKLATDLLVEETKDYELATSRKLVSNLQRSLHTLYGRVEELVSFTRLQNPSLKIEREAISLHQAINSSADLCRPFFADRKQIFSMEVPPSLPLVVGDGFRIEQIIANLLHNASKFSPQGGKIILRAAIVPSDHEAKQMLVEVENHGGPPILPEQLEAIFKPFYTTAPNQRVGLGLGLPIVKRLVELHGGHILATSETGKTTFSFTLPLANK